MVSHIEKLKKKINQLKKVKFMSNTKCHINQNKQSLFNVVLFLNSSNHKTEKIVL